MPFAVAAAGIGLAGSIGGAMISSNAASSAAGKQAQALNNAMAFQQQGYDTEQSNLAPYIGAGQNATYSLAGLLGLPEPQGAPPGAAQNATAAYQQFQNTPYFQFPYQLGIGAMNASGAARGMTLSGGQMNALQQFGQGYASQGLGSYMGMLNQLASLGQGSSTALGNTSVGAGSNILNAATGIGNAQASGIMGQANAINQGINGALGVLGTGQAGSSGLLSQPAFQNLFTGGGMGSSYSLSSSLGNALASSPSFTTPNSGVTIGGF